MSAAGVPHFPALRAGKEYESLDRVQLVSHRDGAPVASVSQVNAGIVRRDLRTAPERAKRLRAMPIAERIERAQSAARIFLEDRLPLGGDTTHGPEDHVAALSSTSGLPHALCRANMQKCAHVLREMPTILAGLTRGLDPSILDTGVGRQNGVPVWFAPTTDVLGAVLPSNSPGVHSLWIPAVVLGTPLALKPGREEPWTPMRIARAMMAAGFPADAFGLYPTDHEGAGALLEVCGRSLLFGDAQVAAKYAGDPRVEVHGPGRSKVLLGDDQADRFEEHLDVLVASIAANGGRSCVNASAVYTPRRGRELAEALAARLAAIVPRAHDDPAALLAAFANPAVADGTDARIEAALAAGGACDVTAAHRGGPRKVTLGGATYLSPTVVHCDALSHALANTEFLFPFASVVEVPQDEMVAAIGPSLVVTALSHDKGFHGELQAAPHIGRLNLGPVATSHVDWDQPHEGNLFEFLHQRRAFARAAGW